MQPGPVNSNQLNCPATRSSQFQPALVMQAQCLKLYSSFFYWKSTETTEIKKVILFSSVYTFYIMWFII